MRLKTLFVGILSLCIPTFVLAEYTPTDDSIRSAFKQNNIDLDSDSIGKIRGTVETAINDRCAHNPTGGNSKVRFASIQIASSLGLNPKIDGTLEERITRAITAIPCQRITTGCDENRRDGCIAPRVDLSWDRYFNETVSLTNNSEFIRLVSEKKFSPVKISWEDIGRYANSAWGDRISDVGIWVRKNETDPSSAQLALSVRRDNNFRDKVLVVPAEKIKIHLKDRDDTREITLPDRLRELGLTSKGKDDQVIVSNQFAIVPVPAKDMNAGGPSDKPARAAFTFSIYPYGSTNYVITDVIEGSSDAIVGPGNHQLLFANVDGQKAPFTASRAAERPDLLKLESELKAKGMDVDVQRYYLIQVPLKKDAKNISLSNMGTPPRGRNFYAPSASIGGDEYEDLVMPSGVGAMGLAEGSAKKMDSEVAAEPMQRAKGLDKVAIGHGETEGTYFTGAGYQGNRAEEPIRVTVVYFVTPVSTITKADMETFTSAFDTWDKAAIWGGSFVVKE